MTLSISNPQLSQMSVKRAFRSKLILSVNAGSSSLKISLYALSPSTSKTSQTKPTTLLLTSSISSISSPPATFSFKPIASTHKSNIDALKDVPVDSITDHASAFAHFLSHLHDEARIDKADIAHVCHRVVHGGDYREPVVINEESYHHIETLSDLAPL